MRNRKMEERKEQEEGEKTPEKGLNQNHALGTRIKSEEKFSCFWGARSWK